MKISTTRFGEIEVNDDAIFTFVMPMIGYEDEDKYRSYTLPYLFVDNIQILLRGDE